MPSLIEIRPVILVSILKFRQCILLFRSYLHLNKFESLSPDDALCFDQNWPVGSGE